MKKLGLLLLALALPAAAGAKDIRFSYMMFSYPSFVSATEFPLDGMEVYSPDLAGADAASITVTFTYKGKSGIATQSLGMPLTQGGWSDSFTGPGQPVEVTGEFFALWPRGGGTDAAITSVTVSGTFGDVTSTKTVTSPTQGAAY